MLTASLGVGYKDYQVVGLFRWAELANDQDPGRGTERIECAASCLPALQGTHVEWDSLEEVVRIACKLSLPAGLSVIEWLFERGRLRYDVALRTLLAEAIGRPHCSAELVDTVYRHLSLPFDSAPDADFLVRLVKRLIASQRQRTTEIVRDLSTHIHIYGLPSIRKRLLRALEGITEHGEAARDRVETIEDDDTTSSTPITYEVDGAKLTESQVAERAVSVDAVRSMLPVLRKSFYPWERALEPLVRRANHQEVLALAERFSQSERSSMVYSLLSRRLLELGRPGEALQLGERAFKLTQPSGWQQYWDGGTRLRALEALALVDRGRTQQLGFGTLISELAAGTADGGPLAVELIRILPLLTDTLPASSIWLEVTWYLAALVAHAGQLEHPSLAALGPVRTGDVRTVESRALCRWMMEYVDHPANALSRSAQRAVIELLERNDDTIREFVRDYLSKDPTELGLIAVAAAGIGDTQVIAPFTCQLGQLVAARQFGVRSLARRLFETLPISDRREVVPAAPEPRSMPPAYDLAYRRRGAVRRIVEVPISSEEFLPPTDDAAELVSPWHPEADLIARMANVQPEALYQRTTELMVELGGRDFDTVEHKLRQRLDGMELKLGFRRPRAALARRALGVATAELIDAGRIPDVAFESLDTILRAGDPAMLRQRPGPRPTWIAPISERAEKGHYSTGWESQVSTARSALLEPENIVGGVVIAEETHLRWLEWERPEEIRVGACVRGVPPTSILDRNDPLVELCANWPHELVAEYENLEGDGKHLAGMQNGYRFETPGNRWLAFNPSVALSLGWVLDQSVLFRWIDSSSVLMVETLLWQDGLYEQQPPKFDDEVGWGWLVRASSAGWAAICNAYEVRSRAVCVMRKSNKVPWQRATALSSA